MPMSAYKRRLRAKVGPTMLISPGVVAFIYDDQGRLLLQQRGDGRWGLPAGEIDPDETPAEALVREMWEEMRVIVRPERVLGVYGGPDWAMVHDNGDQDSYLDIVFLARIVEGTIQPDGIEVLAAAYLTPEAIANRPLSRSDQRLLEVAFPPPAASHFHPPTWQPPANGQHDGGISAYMRQLRAKVGTDRLLMPAVGAIIRDTQGRILIQQRADNQTWSMPGGALDPLESPADATVREVWEETGLIVAPERLAGVYGGSVLHHVYPNGDQIAVVSLVFDCRVISGQLQPDGTESQALVYVEPAEALARLQPRWQIRLASALQAGTNAQFQPPALPSAG